MPINLSEAAAKITNGPRSCTNPFLNGSIVIPEDEHPPPPASIYIVEQEKLTSNPFAPADSNYFQFNGNDPFAKDSITNNLDTCAESFLDKNVFDHPDTSSEFTTQFRNRSMSETEAVEILTTAEITASSGGRRSSNDSINSSSSTNPFRTSGGGGNLQKTLSETTLEQYSVGRTNGRNGSNTWMFGRSLARQNSNMSLAKSMGSQSSFISDTGEVDLKRAMSCDSVSSESSVVLADLEVPVPTVTGLLCVGLQYDK